MIHLNSKCQLFIFIRKTQELLMRMLTAFVVCTLSYDMLQLYYVMCS